jgi:polyhydroxybutyrate depolymerase
MSKKSLLIFVVVVLVLVVAVTLVRHKRASNVPAAPVVTTPSTPGTAVVGESDHVISYKGLERVYTVYVPKNYNPATIYPLVVLLHGGDGNGDNMISKLSGTGPKGKRLLTDLKFEAKADTNNFIIVAPDGYGGNWNDGRTGTDPAALGTDDVGFIVAVVDEVSATYNINSKKVYSTGISNGGTMSYRLACERPDVFAAVATDVAATVKTIAATCTAAVPILGIQGTLDPLMTFDGGPSKFSKQMGNPDPTAPSQVLPAMDNMKLWVKNNGCNQTPTITRMPTIVKDDTTVDRYTFTGCKTARAVEYYVVNGMGHVWPPNSKAAISFLTGPSSGNINATDVITEFLLAHSK